MKISYIDGFHVCYEIFGLYTVLLCFSVRSKISEMKNMYIRRNIEGKYLSNRHLASY
jgi:hypothetical protein